MCWNSSNTSAVMCCAFDAKPVCQGFTAIQVACSGTRSGRAAMPGV